MDVGQNSSGRDGDSSQKLVELLIVLDGKGDVPGDDAGLLVVASGVAGKLEDLGAEVLEDGGEVNPGTLPNALGVAALLQVPANTGNGELKTSLGGGANALSGTTSSLSLSSGSRLSLSWRQRRRRRRREGQGGGGEGREREGGENEGESKFVRETITIKHKRSSKKYATRL